jgi:hypothetical protein
VLVAWLRPLKGVVMGAKKQGVKSDLRKITADRVRRIDRGLETVYAFWLKGKVVAVVVVK